MYLIEAVQESLGLILDAPGHPPLSHEVQVFLLVLLRHLDVRTSDLQVVGLDFPWTQN